jgi:hypothetical protein
MNVTLSTVSSFVSEYGQLLFPESVSIFYYRSYTKGRLFDASSLGNLRSGLLIAASKMRCLDLRNVGIIYMGRRFYGRQISGDGTPAGGTGKGPGVSAFNLHFAVYP